MDASPSDTSRRNSPQPATAALRPKIVASHASSADAGTATATAAPIPDEDHGVDLPMTMAASVVLTGLPQDAHRALADAEAIDTGKGMLLCTVFLFSS